MVEEAEIGLPSDGDKASKDVSVLGRDDGKGEGRGGGPNLQGVDVGSRHGTCNMFPGRS